MPFLIHSTALNALNLLMVLAWIGMPFMRQPWWWKGPAGDDSLTGTGHNDTLRGLAGNDSLAGYNGNDILDGGAGDDTLVARYGHNTLIGGEGNDTLLLDRGYGSSSAYDDYKNTFQGGKGNDILQGHYGQDSYVFNIGDGQDTINDIGGSDKLVFV